MTEQAASKSTAPALGISVSVNLSERHAITMQTHVDSEASAEQINTMVDKIAGVSDRLIARYSLVALRKNLEVHETMVRRAKQDLMDLDARHQKDFVTSGKKGGLNLTNAQAADRNNSMKSIERFELEIEKIKAEIRDAEKEAT